MVRHSLEVHELREAIASLEMLRFNDGELSVVAIILLNALRAIEREFTKEEGK